jgi:hypothetical protein
MFISVSVDEVTEAERLSGIVSGMGKEVSGKIFHSDPGKTLRVS